MLDQQGISQKTVEFKQNHRDIFNSSAEDAFNNDFH